MTVRKQYALKDLSKYKQISLPLGFSRGILPGVGNIFTIVCVLSHFFEENQMVNDAVILNVDNLRQRLKGDLTCLFHPPKRGVHMMPCPLNCGSWWCPNSKVILSLIDHPSRAQGHVCRKQKKSYKERFSSGVYAIYSQAHIPSPNFSSEHHTSHPNYLLGFSMLPKRHLKFNVQN